MAQFEIEGKCYLGSLDCVLSRMPTKLETTRHPTCGRKCKTSLELSTLSSGLGGRCTGNPRASKTHDADEDVLAEMSG